MGEGAEAHKAFVKVERMTMDALMMALSLLVLLTLMAVARTHEVEGRRMLQFKELDDVEDVPGFPDSGEYKKLCNKFFGGLGGCEGSLILREYNKKFKSKEEEKQKREEQRKKDKDDKDDKDDNDSSSSNDDDDDNDSGGGGGGDAISFNFMSTFPATTNSQPSSSTDRLTGIASRLQQQVAAEKQTVVASDAESQAAAVAAATSEQEGQEQEELTTNIACASLNDETEMAPEEVIAIFSPEETNSEPELYRKRLVEMPEVEATELENIRCNATEPGEESRAYPVEPFEMMSALDVLRLLAEQIGDGGRRMLLQVSSATDIPKKEYNKLCKKYYDEDLGNCLDSKVLRAYNKQVKSKKAEEKKDEEKKEREKKEREKERNDKDDN